jgi:hypothetical protein
MTDIKDNGESPQKYDVEMFSDLDPKRVELSGKLITTAMEMVREGQLDEETNTQRVYVQLDDEQQEGGPKYYAEIADSGAFIEKPPFPLLGKVRIESKGDMDSGLSVHIIEVQNNEKKDYGLWSLPRHVDFAEPRYLSAIRDANVTVEEMEGLVKAVETGWKERGKSILIDKETFNQISSKK